MHTFLTKLAQVDSIQEVILVSSRGEILFEKRAEGAGQLEGGLERWKEIIAGLDGAPTAEFHFEKGCFYLHDLGIGHVIVGMTNARVLDRVKTACVQVSGKLGDAAVRKRVLLKMLAEVAEAFKPHLVRALYTLLEGGDRETGAQLIALLRQAAQGNPLERESLLLALCETLGHQASPEVLAALQDFLEEHRGRLPGAVETAARVSIQQLTLDLPSSGETAHAKKTEQPADVRSGPLPASSGGSTGDRRQVEELLAVGKKDEAIERILAAIEVAAKNRQFDQAERLREWLMEIDSMALREVIKAAEIIEQAKRVSISREFQETWKDLALALSSEEFSALYHAMSSKSFAKDEMVVRQGEFISTLFFVNSGRVQLFAVSQDREIPLKICNAGEILGAANFFDISVWTVNARSLGTEILFLGRKELLRQKEIHPAFEGKLLEFCSRFPSPNTLFSKTGRSRRQFERKKTSGQATIVVLDEQEKETGVGAKGDILDVSRGGMSFSLRFSRKKNAEALLGRKIKVNMRSDKSSTSVTCNATIKAVRCCDFIGSDYSLHVQFQQELDNTQLQQVMGKGR